MAEFGGDDLFSVFEECGATASPGTGSNHGNKNSSPIQREPRTDVERTEELLSSIAASTKRTKENESARNEDEPEDKKAREDAGYLLETMPRIQVHRVATVEACLHEVAIPPDAEFQPLVVPTTTPVKEYPFILDPFQKEALLCLENQQSVLVSAHTSAGKTVVAEYAIAMSLRDKQRVIYTTPIKALSNQKYRELFEEFQDVGLMTGDVTINPSASCLVMTTEILRSMLYRGSEIMREMAWVIFDEIHYMRDKERGVVWEETIILLPDNVHYVFLSATIPNARQFAEWICYLHKQPCHVVYTDYRPTPLQHYIYPAGGDGIHLVVDENGVFREENFTAAMSVLKDGGDASKEQGAFKASQRNAESNCFKLVKMIMERNFAPVIVFSFSKKDCEAYAIQVSKLDFNSDEEKKMVDEVFHNAIDSLSDDDKKLPQVEHVLPLLKKGIGIHHSGLLPLLKETIEILFSEGLIKALFATETFAMGLNMPARTVMFTSARKFDGKEFRWITSGEYIQMSGRAGRRGIDDRGIVILMVDEKMPAAAGQLIVKGEADPLNSAFHLTYNMVLNLLRVEGINPEYMLERSFFQFQNYAAIPGLHEKLTSLEDKHKKIAIKNEEQIASYYKIRQQLDSLALDLLSYIHKPQYTLPFLQVGRLVTVKHGDDDFGWGAVVNFQKKTVQAKDQTNEPKYVVEVLCHVTKDSADKKQLSSIKPCPPGESGEMQVVPVMLELISAISAVRIFMPKDLRPIDSRISVLKSIKEVVKRFPDGLPRLDPIEDMNIKEKGLHEVIKTRFPGRSHLDLYKALSSEQWEKIEAFEHRLHSHPLSKDTNIEDLYNLYHSKVRVGAEIKGAKSELKKKKSLLQMDDLKRMKRVLRRLGYCTACDIIELKGRVACEISSVDELLVTELLFNNVFNDLSVEQTAALFSCFVFQENSSEMPKLTEKLSGPLRIMQDTARRIARVSKEAKIELDAEEYVDGFRPHMMDVVNSWCQGHPFSHICKLTDIFEGSIIRCMRRLEETLRQMVQAAKAIGNTELENKFTEGIRLIKRDIVFAASLYL